MDDHYDVGVVGAGILGLAHAYELARRGLRVVVLERHPRAQGASVRNFGMIWPVGQPDGATYQMARRSRQRWLEVLEGSGLWHARCGSLHLAYHDDEAHVLREFIDLSRDQGRPCELLTATETLRRFPAVRRHGLKAGLWSPEEMGVDPRQVIAELPGYLSRRFGVEFRFGTTVTAFRAPWIATTRGDVRAARLVVSTGADFRELFPDAYAETGLLLCKLQMMRSQSFAGRFQLGTMIAGGLTLRHYRSFARCPTLPALARRMDAEFAEYGRYGIHVMAAQNEAGELVIGDSHEYGDAIEPFDKTCIDELILRYLHQLIELPDLTIAARWHGLYVKHPTEPFLVAYPQPEIMAVTAVGGAGMTLSFGLAEESVNGWLGERHD